MDPTAPPRLHERRGVSAREDRRALELDARGEPAQRPHARLDPGAAHRGRAPRQRRALLARPPVELGERPGPALHRRDAEIDELDRLAAALVSVARPVGGAERHGQGRRVVDRGGGRYPVTHPPAAKHPPAPPPPHPPPPTHPPTTPCPSSSSHPTSVQ